MACSMAALSPALRVIGPMWSRLSDKWKMPWRLTRPQVGLTPVRLLAADGMRIEPAVSVPIAP